MPFSDITNRNASNPRSHRIFASDKLDFEVLKAFERVKSDDGSDILIELIDLYLQGASQRIMAMRNAAREVDLAQLKRAAHTLKGSSSTLGLREIARICQDLEGACANPRGEVQTIIGLLESKFLEMKPVLIGERNRRRVLSQ